MTLDFIDHTSHTEIVEVGHLHVSEDDYTLWGPGASEKDTRVKPKHLGCVQVLPGQKTLTVRKANQR